MSQNQSAPRPGSAKTDLYIIFTVLAIWLVPYGLLWIATKLAGGDPHYSPVEFLDFPRIGRDYKADGGLVPWHLVGGGPGTSGFLFYAVLVLIVGGVAFVCWSVYAAIQGGGNTSSRTGQVGYRLSRYLVPRNLKRTSNWANWYDLRHLRSGGPRKGCLTIGTRGKSLIVTEPETSLLVIGPTRSGKTSGLIIPNLFEWDGPAIVTSTKSELVEITGAYRQSVGPVYIYDPTGEISDRYQTVTWSPIAGCESLDYAIQVASWLCAGLQQGKQSGSSDNDWEHWAASGKLLIAPLLFTAARTGQHTILDVRDWVLQNDVSQPMAILQDMMAYQEHPERSDEHRAIGMLMSIDQRPDKERGTVFSTVTRIFQHFLEKAVAESGLTSRFDAKEFLRRKGTLYLCSPARAPERVASLFVGILMTAVTEAYIMSQRMPRGRLDPELGLFLDELANVVPIEDLPGMASQGAGRGVILMSVVQDFSQLRTRYGADKANSILNNHGATVVLPGIRDPETTEQVAKMIGRSNYTDVSISRQDGKDNRSYSVKQDQMATPDALRQLRPDTAVMVYKGTAPTIVRLRPWYRDGQFKALAARKFFRNADYVSFRKSA